MLVKLQHGVVGLPDRLLVRPDSTVVFIEFKRLRASPTKIQSYQLARLRRMRHRAVVVTRMHEFRDLLTA